MRTRIAVVVVVVGLAAPGTAQQLVEVTGKSGTLNPGQQTDLEFRTRTDTAGTIQSHQHDITVTYSPPGQWVFGLLQFWRPNTNPPSWWTMLRGYGVDGELRASFGAPAYRSGRRWRFRVRHEDIIDGDDSTVVRYDVRIRRRRQQAGGADFDIVEARRYKSRLDVAHWFYYAVQANVPIDHMRIPVRIHHAEFFTDCSDSYFDLEAGEREDGLVIPDICGSDTPWSAIELMAPAGRTCTGCRLYTFEELPLSTNASPTAPNGLLEEQRVLDDFEIRLLTDDRR